MRTDGCPEVVCREGLLGYEEGLALQDLSVGDLLMKSSGERIHLVEHEPVYSIGRIRDRSSLGGGADLPHPVFETNRGGQATYHGPGQLTGYPILDLNRRGKDLHLHLRLIEDALILISSDLGIEAVRREGMTGVWVENRKLASIGVGVRKWISMHGFALNVRRESLPPFLAITPCGLTGVSMTCLEAECGREISMKTASDLAADRLREVFG